MTKFRICQLAMAGIFACCSAVAGAATVSYEAGLPLIEDPAEIDRSYSLGLFDSTLGSLTGVSLELFGSATFSLVVFNPGAQSQQLSLVASQRQSWGSNLPGLAALLATEPVDLSFSSGLFAVGPGGSQSFGPVARSGSRTLDAAGLLALGNSLSAPGGGSFNLNCRSISDLTVTGGGGIQVPFSSTAGCGARLVYTYEPATGAVPLPGTAALAGLGLLALALNSRRQRPAGRR